MTVLVFIMLSHRHQNKQVRKTIQHLISITVILEVLLCKLFLVDVSLDDFFYKEELKMVKAPL